MVIADIDFKDAKLKQCVMETAANHQWTHAYELTTLHCQSATITDANDIRWFINLEQLDLSSNQLTTLDVSANSALTTLILANNKLTTLNVLSNTALTTLNVDSNQLSVIDVSANTLLSILNVSFNNLSVLNCFCQ